MPMCACGKLVVSLTLLLTLALCGGACWWLCLPSRQNIINQLQHLATFLLGQPFKVLHQLLAKAGAGLVAWAVRAPGLGAVWGGLGHDHILS